MILGFDVFDPLTGTYPSTIPEIGSDIVFRARDLIKHRSKEEILEGIKIVNWLITESPVHDESWSQLLTEAQALDQGVEEVESDTDSEESNEELDLVSEPKRYFHAFAYSLVRSRDKFDLSNYPDFTNAKWYELFAILALGLINVACEDEISYQSWAKSEDNIDWLHEWRIHTHVTDWLIEATDAVSKAEGIYEVEMMHHKIEVDKAKLSLRNSQASVISKDKTNKAILSFDRFYVGSKYKSVRSAVDVFCKQHEELVAHLKPYNRIRTLSEAYSNYVRGLRRTMIDR